MGRERADRPRMTTTIPVSAAGADNTGMGKQSAKHTEVLVAGDSSHAVRCVCSEGA